MGLSTRTQRVWLSAVLACGAWGLQSPSVHAAAGLPAQLGAQAAGDMAAQVSATAHRADLIDTRRGTDSNVDYSHGNTYPATALPFGFNLWTPLTHANSHRWLYSWQAPRMFGLALTHQASPWLKDYGVLQVMAEVGHATADPNARGVAFEHANEHARPYRYAVRLNNGVEMAVVPTMHAALMSFGFPQGAPAFLTFDDIAVTRGKLDVDEAQGVVSGYTSSPDDADVPHTMFIYAKLRQARITEHGALAARSMGTYLAVTPTGKGPVELAIGTSWISLADARRAMQDEVDTYTDDHLAEAGRAAWDDALSPVTVTGASPDEQRMFYNNMFRTLLYPTSMTEGDQDPRDARHHSPYDGREHPGTMHINNGFWDTYRAVWPLHVLLRPRVAGQMLQSFVHAYKDSGWTPRWSAPGHIDIMLGTHLNAVFADAYLKGVRNFDTATAFAASLKDASVVSPFDDQGRPGRGHAAFDGFVADEAAHHAAAWHLEDCTNDYALSRWAKALGRADDAAYLDYKASQYKNLYSPSVGFFRGRKADGSWRTPDAAFSPTAWGHEFIEGAPWHYIMPVPFDAQGTAKLYGGNHAMRQKLDALFAAPRGYDVGSYGRIIHEMTEAYDADMGQYAHPNEPVHHLIWMYTSLGDPSQTQKRSRALLDPNAGIYTLGLDDGQGYLGDEDNGQMSAWYVFAAMGLYPVTPGVPEYVIGSPLFDSVAMRLEDGKTFRIVAQNNSPTNIYVQQATLNGAPYTRAVLSHADIVAGGELVLHMGAKPSHWGEHQAAWPASRTDGVEAVGPSVDVLGLSQVEVAAAGPYASYAAHLTDNDAATVWRADAAQAQLVMHVDDDAGPPRIRQYTLTAGGAGPGCDPATWSLEASPDGATWQLIDSRHDEMFDWPYMTRGFALVAPSDAKHYRLTLRNRSGEACLQLAELELLGH